MKIPFDSFADFKARLEAEIAEALAGDPQWRSAYRDGWERANYLSHLEASWEPQYDGGCWENFKVYWYKQTVLYFSYALYRAIFQIEHHIKGRQTRKDSGERTAGQVAENFRLAFGVKNCQPN